MYHARRSSFRIAVCFLLLLIITFSAAIYTSVEAASKPSIESKMTIGTGSLVGNYDYYSKEDDKYVLYVTNAVKNAAYSFTSSNSKVVSVKASGKNAYLTGLKAGTATITCNQKLNGKTTKVGICAVTVKNSTVSQDFIPEVPLGTSFEKEALEFSYRNNDATYTFISNSKNFTMKETISKFDGMNFIKHSFTATVPGTYTVTVKETYNKVTRVVGTIKYSAKKATVIPEYTIDVGSEIWAYDLINNYMPGVKHLFYSPDEEADILDGYVRDETVYFKGLKAGTTTITIYENTTTRDESKLIGTCKITVKEVVLEDFEYGLSETEISVGGDSSVLYVEKEPYNAPEAVTVTSSNPEVATISEMEEEDYWKVTPVSAGTATITITCGDITKTQTITVLEEVNEDEE